MVTEYTPRNTQENRPTQSTPEKSNIPLWKTIPDRLKMGWEVMFGKAKAGKGREVLQAIVDTDDIRSETPRPAEKEVSAVAGRVAESSLEQATRQESLAQELSVQVITYVHQLCDTEYNAGNITASQRQELQQIANVILASETPVSPDVLQELHTYPVSAARIIRVLEIMNGDKTAFNELCKAFEEDVRSDPRDKMYRLLDTRITDRLEQPFETNRYVSPQEIVALAFVTKKREPSSQQQIARKLREIPQVTYASMESIRALAIVDDEAAFNLLLKKQQEPAELVYAVASNCDITADYIERAPAEVKPFIEVIKAYPDMPLTFLDVVNGVFQIEKVTFPLSDETIKGLHLLMSDPDIVPIIAKSQYFQLFRDVLCNHSFESYEQLRSLLKASDVDQYSAIMHRTKQQLHSGLMEKMSEIAQQKLESNIAPASEQIIIDRLRSVYSDSFNHTGASEGVTRFTAHQKGTFYVRGNSIEGSLKILKSGCYAQEYIPGAQVVNNFFPGYLNSIVFNDMEPQQALQAAVTNENFGKYGGDQCILVFSPSTETKDWSSAGTERFPNQDTQMLTAVGMSTEEIASVITYSSESRDQIIANLVASEKYIPVYDKDGTLLFSEKDYVKALEEKRFQSAQAFLEQPPVQHLAEEPDGHGEGTLLEHTRRVVDATGTYISRTDTHASELIHIAAFLHDIGKNAKGAGQQSAKNLATATPVLDQIRGLSLRDKQLITLAIHNDDIIGADILANLPLDASDEQILIAREKIVGLFPDTEALRFGLDLFYADVTGIGTDKKALEDWQVQKKLTLLKLAPEDLA